MSAGWSLIGFEDRYDEWVSQEDPPNHTRRAVLNHVLSRMDDPYADVRREPGFADLWSGEVPRTRRGWSFVHCSYWISERERTVRCDRIATLEGPL